MLKFLRHPQTTAERRAYAAAAEQGVRIRAARHPGRLPQYFDDITRGDATRHGRNDAYKNHRR